MSGVAVGPGVGVALPLLQLLPAAAVMTAAMMIRAAAGPEGGAADTCGHGIDEDCYGGANFH